MKKITLLLSLIILFALGQSQAQNCHADFMYYANPQGSNTIQFVDSSWANSGNPNYLWHFGDGDSAFVANPIHTYNAPGQYLVQLIYTTTTNCYSYHSDTITVGGGCTADFSYSAYQTNTVTFNNQSTPISGSTFLWNFDDNSTSTAANPVHTYSNSGVYVVSLTVNPNLGSSCTTFDTVYVNYCNPYFTPNFGGNGNVTFINQSIASPHTFYNWNFGDGPNGAYTHGRTNVSHTYTASGTYIVSLGIHDSITGCNTTYYDTINIQLNNPQNCNASFNVVKDSSAQYKVILYNTSSNAASHTYSWDFGDGITGSGRTPQHQYQNFGTYLVCLTITDNQLNCTSTFCDSVGMDSLGNLKAPGFGLEVRNPTITSIDKNETNSLSELSIYPNPAKSNLSIDLSGFEGLAQMKLIDLSGKTIYRNPSVLGGNIEQVDLTQYENGFYFLIIDDSQNRRVEKIVINK